MSTAVYVRVSTARQSQAQTIDQPWARLQAHLAAQGEELRSEQIFRDDGYSGASLNRPGLDHRRDAVKAAAFDRVLVTTPDRLARNYVHQMLLLEELERVGCRVEFLERPMSQDPHDQLVLQIRSAVAEYERTLIAERMRRAWYRLGWDLYRDHLVGIEERFQVFGANPIASADFAGLELAGFDEPLQMALRDVEHLSGLVGGHDGFGIGGAF